MSSVRECKKKAGKRTTRGKNEEKKAYNNAVLSENISHSVLSLVHTAILDDVVVKETCQSTKEDAHSLSSDALLCLEDVYGDAEGCISRPLSPMDMWVSSKPMVNKYMGIRQRSISASRRK